MSDQTTLLRRALGAIARRAADYQDLPEHTLVAAASLARDVRTIAQDALERFHEAEAAKPVELTRRGAEAITLATVKADSDLGRECLAKSREKLPGAMTAEQIEAHAAASRSLHAKAVGVQQQIVDTLAANPGMLARVVGPTMLPPPVLPDGTTGRCTLGEIGLPNGSLMLFSHTARGFGGRTQIIFLTPGAREEDRREALIHANRSGCAVYDCSGLPPVGGAA